MKSFRFFLFFLLSGVALRSFSQGLPIKPTRTISFKTDEGTNMDVDVSPDGKTLLFTLLGDIYSVPSTGGKATQLTRGMAINIQPRWSPDGKKIAYLSDGSGSYHVNVRDLKGSFNTVLNRENRDLMDSRDSNLIWTPDGNYVVLGNALYGLAGDKKITDTNSKWPVGFSKDGRMVYSMPSRYIPGFRIFGYDRESKKQLWESPVMDWAASGALSSDTRWWCYYSDSNNNRCLLLVDLEKNETKMLVSKMFVQDPYAFRQKRYPHFSFSRDSKYIFVGYAGKIHRIETQSGKDVIIPFLADVKSDLGPFNYNTYKISDRPDSLKYIRSANASPDGKKLVFSALNKIYVMDLPIGEPHILADQPLNQFQPVYSPDGQWIAYVSFGDSAEGGVWRVPAAGGVPEQLTHVAGEYLYPTWTPDGTGIAFLKTAPNFHSPKLIENEIGNLQLISLRGKFVSEIVDSIPVLNSFAFSPDGGRIFYTPRSKRVPWVQPQQVSKALDGNGLDTIANGLHLPYHVKTILSPDGKYLVYSADEDLFLFPISKMKLPVTLLQKSQEIIPIRFAAGVDPYWEKNGKVLAWTYGNRFYRVDPDKVLATYEKEDNKSEATRSTDGRVEFATAWTEPDEVVTMPLSFPKYYAHGTIALTNVRILTMHGEEVIEKGTIVIKDRRILAVGAVSAIKAPAGAETVDLAGTTIMPGLVDLHYHIGVVSSIIPQQFWALQAALAYGTTTIRDPSQHLVGYNYETMINSGLLVGPRLYTVGDAVTSPNGILRWNSLDDVQQVVRKRLRMGSIIVKNYATTSMRIQREWIQIACQNAGLNMTNEGLDDPLMDVAMMKDGNTGIEHNPEWQDVYKDVLTFYGRSGTFFTPTSQVTGGSIYGKGKLYFNYEYWRQPDEKLKHFSFSNPKQKPEAIGLESIEVITRDVPFDKGDMSGLLILTAIDGKIRKLGGRVTLGSHGNGGGTGPHSELWALQMGGLTNMEALQAGTIMGAEALGLQKDLGSLEVGKIADLIVLNKNPLDDIHNSREIRYVMKDGILYDGNNLDELWPEKKKCPDWRQPIDMGVVPPPPSPQVPPVILPARD